MCARSHQSPTQRKMAWNETKRECPETSNMKAMNVLMAIADDNRIKFRIVMRNVPEIGFRFTHTPNEKKTDHMISFQAERRKWDTKCKRKQHTHSNRSGRAFCSNGF